MVITLRCAGLIRVRAREDCIGEGAGVFGAWTAYQLRRTGRSVTLVDAFGPGNSRASSGGESRIIRIGYGDDEVYSRSALESLGQWQILLHEARRPLFVQTGVLFFGRDDDPLIDATTLMLERLGVNTEFLARRDLETRFPQFRLGSVERGVFEPESGVILARRAVDTVVQEAVRRGVEYRLAAVQAPRGTPATSPRPRTTTCSSTTGTCPCPAMIASTRARACTSTTLRSMWKTPTPPSFATKAGRA